MAGEFDVMNSPEFGAFGGQKFVQDAKQRDLTALDTMAKIEAAPVDMALKQAHAQYYGAEAQAKMQAAAAERQAGEIMRRAAEAYGVQPAGKVNQEDILSSVFDGAAKAGNWKLAKDAATAKSSLVLKTAQAGSAAATQAYNEMRALDRQVQIRGAAAGSVTDQASYERYLGQLLEQGDPTALEMPLDFGSAQPMLRQRVQESIKSADKVRAAQTSLAFQETQRRNKVRDYVDNIRIKRMEARNLIDRERLDLLKKTAGAKDAEVQSRERRLNAREARIAAEKDLKLAPLPTPEQLKDPSKRVVGQTYTLPTGKYTWQGNGWIKASSTTAVPATDEEATDDGLDDDEDD